MQCESGKIYSKTKVQENPSLTRKTRVKEQVQPLGHSVEYAALLIASLLLAGGVAYHYLEGWSWIDSFYFATVALTTVGFGDLVPSTDAAKIFTMIYLMAGIGIMFYTLTVLGRSYVANIFEKIMTAPRKLRKK